MVLSRFWYVLLGLFLGLSVFLLSIATSMYNRAGARSMGEALSSDSQVVAWYLRDDARQRSGRLIQFGVDPDIAKYLQKSTDSEAKVPEDSKDKLQAALKKVNASIPKDEQFDAVFAVDQGGRVVVPPGCAIGSEVSRQRFFSPGAAHRRRDRGKSRHRLVAVRIFERDGQRAVPAHGMAEDAGARGIDGKRRGNQLG